MKNDQQEAFERVLVTSLARVVDFLKFAEAKNAALLTFASAWIIGSINLLNGSNKLSDDWRACFTIALPILSAAALLSLFSFLPRTLLGRFHKDPEQKKALLYFGDAATFSPAAYKDRVWDRYNPPDNESATRSYLDDLAVQIAVNSQITTRKLKIFNAAAFFIVVAMLAILAPGIKASALIIAPLLGVGP
ncbi:Pycsar system effector family protein [Rhizobium ruizarguesonis]|uniref:Pycsar system effector family protein n=1 Tax=Rhizobium TaxID=379 RepID=UPI00102FB9E4|nr:MULTISPECIES: Pycsar system effector family protein [Rhizobium]MBC2804801.1 hypothetical protein [Rhizobium ruizarguesonis]TBC74053.1 hypothetical protein ELH27_14845 [Rhizobium leguminosarum]